MDRLFVYGSLAPNRANHHVISHIQGTWEPAKVKGKLHEQGWGAALGYPAIEPCESAESVEGWVLCSEQLAQNWQLLDEFEGTGYQRVEISILLESEVHVRGFVYALNV